MKFRASIGGNQSGQAASQGLASLAAAFLNRDQNQQMAEMQAMPSFAQAAAAQAQARRYDAEVPKLAEETRGLRMKNDLTERRPQFAQDAALDAAGAVGPMRQALLRYRESGNWGDAVPNPALAGPPEPGQTAVLSPAQPPAGVDAPMVRAFMSTLAAANLGGADGGNSTAGDLAKAAQTVLGGRLQGDVLSGALDPQRLAVANMAAKGDSPYHFNEFGVGNNYTGAVDASSPVAQRFGEYRTAATGAQRANATQSLAAADASAASAGLHRAQTTRLQQTPIPTAVDANGNLVTPKPMPPAALKMQEEDLNAIGQFAGLDSDLAAIEQQIAGGKLPLGPISNVMSTARNATGFSTPESRNLASFRAKLENMRNATLLLNKGVQTEGDAQRAMNELFSNLNDPGVVQQRLGEIRALNRRAVELRKLNVDQVRQNFGHAPMDFSRYETQPPAVGVGGAPARVGSDAEYNALPSGATFIAPDGTTRRKP